MRIIAGNLKGRILATPRGANTRPTSGRVREALFQHLQSARLHGGFVDLRVLDLFAGSGALGIEAISRGAATVEFYEEERHALQALQTNIAQLGLRDACTTIKGHLPKTLSRSVARADLIFCDPPYRFILGSSFFDSIGQRAARGAWLVYEHDANAAAPHDVGPWRFDETRQWGRTAVSFYRYEMP